MTSKEQEFCSTLNNLSIEYIACNGWTDEKGRTFVNLGEFLTALGLNINPNSSMFDFSIAIEEES